MRHPRRSHALSATAIVLACALAALAASCFVHRASDDYACTTTDDCRSGRVCDQGFCVIAATAGCPAACSSCDAGDMTCRIDCTANKPCGDVACPVGWDCSIHCNGPMSCGAIDCRVAGSCSVDCGAASACGDLRCGAGACNVRCSGAGACPSIDCAASCSCDVTCNSQAIDCPQMTCPRAIGPCTQNGSDGAVCASSEPGCGLCIDI